MVFQEKLVMERIISWELPDGYYAYMGQNRKRHIKTEMLTAEELSSAAKRVAQYSDEEYATEYKQLASEVEEKFPDAKMPELTENQQVNTTILTLDSEGLVTKKDIDLIFNEKLTALVKSYKDSINTYIGGKVTELKDILSTSREEVQGIKDAVSKNKVEIKSDIERAVNIAKDSTISVAKVGTEMKAYEPVLKWYEKNHRLSEEEMMKKISDLGSEILKLVGENEQLRESLKSYATKADIDEKVKGINTIENGDFGVRIDENGIWLKFSKMEGYKQLGIDDEEKMYLK